MKKEYRAAQDLNGNALPGATVQIKNSASGANAPLFEDDEVASKANPLTANSSGVVSFKVADGIYDIVVTSGAYTNTETLVSIFESPDVVQLQNADAVTFGYGDLVYIFGSGTVKRAKSNGTEAEASAEAVCLETALTPGSTGRFKINGAVSGLSGTPGAIGYLSQTGTITNTVPTTGAGDVFSTIVGRFSKSSTMLLKSTFPFAL